MAAGGFRMGDLKPVLEPAPKGGDITETIGRAFVNKMLSDLTEGVVSANQTSGVGQVRELMGALKDADDLTERRERRRREHLEEELEDLRDELKRLARARNDRGQGDDTLSTMLQLLIKQSDEKLALFMQQQQMMLELLTKDKKGDSEDFFRQLGLQQIQQALQADPIQTYEQQRQYWEARLGADVGENRNLKEWEIKEKYALRRRELDIEEKRATAELESRTQGLQTLGQVAAALTGVRTGEAAATDGAPTPPGLYDYTCAQCGHRWIQPTLDPELTCPKCQAHLTTGTPEATHDVA